MISRSLLTFKLVSLRASVSERSPSTRFRLLRASPEPVEGRSNLKKDCFLPAGRQASGCPRNDTGFTLVEVLVTTLITSFIIAAIFATLNIGDAARHTESGLLDLQQDGRLGMYRMVNELRQSKASYIVISNAGAQIDFRIPTDISTSPATFSSNISYYLNDSNQIIREYPSGTTSILASNISSVTFTLSSNNLTIDMTASKTEMQRSLSLSFLEKVRLRNDL